MDKFALGWSPEWDHLLDQHDQNRIVRITERNRDFYRAITFNGTEVSCRSAGLLFQSAESSAELPVCGDWCVLRSTPDESATALILSVLPRRSAVSRINAGTTSDEQVLAANVDFLFITTSANRDFNINRLRRYLLTAHSGKTTPVIVITKADLPEADTLTLKIEVSEHFPDVLCLETSAFAGVGLHSIEALLSAGKTAAFIGSSGVGKSTLVNALLRHDVQKTSDIRASDQRGRHTTSASGLFFTARGGMIIDTPGLRELQVSASDDDLRKIMPTIPELALACKFADCTHTIEPGCRVSEALAEGQLTESEFAAFAKLQREIAYSNRRVDQRLAAKERDRWKKITKNARDHMKHKRGGE